ncbi:hypothetical protein LSAT2_008424 [Lamellibrachia satsuma]|nr:hypothetical protein LSAT2_008424 [Lamellibrachia satsuma]
MDGCVAGTACRGDDFVFYNETNVFSGTSPNDSSGNVSAQGPIRQADAQCALFRFVFYGIVCFVICLVGFVGNIISFVVFRRDKSSPAASFILQALAVADNAFLLLWLGHYPLHSSGRFDQLPKSFHTVIEYLRVYTFPLLYMAQTQTIWLTVAVALNRFTAVCFPYRAHRYRIVTSAFVPRIQVPHCCFCFPYRAHMYCIVTSAFVPRIQVPHCYFCFPYRAHRYRIVTSASRTAHTVIVDI